MQESAPWFLQNAHWIVLLPFLSGAFIIFFNAVLSSHVSKVAGKTLCMLASVGTVFALFAQSLAIFAHLREHPRPYLVDFDWFVSESFKLTTGILVDNLAAMMLLVVTTVSLLVQIYTHGYMREDPGYNRFYAYLSLFTGSMLGLVLSTNLFQMFIFWELVGVCSYFLIGFWWNRPTAAAACVKAFVVNRVGDFGFLVGILFFFLFTYQFWHAHPDHGVLSFFDPTGNGVDLSGAIRWAMDPAHQQLTQTWLGITACLIFMGPMAKSAQAPLHVWLPDAMEGPTPISALIHAATMVAAGIYMVARAYPIWLDWTNPADPSTASFALAWVAWVGGLTALMAATIAMTQVDIKRALAWSTVSQLGYMFVGLGVGAYSAGMFHLTTHAFFKAMLFLCSGAVIHALHGEQDMRKMGGLWSKTWITAGCFLIGTLSISGCPGMAGFFSKDEIIGAALNWHAGPWLGWLMVLTAGLTSFYMFRMFYMTFTGDYRGKVHPHEETTPDPLTMPLIVLAVPSVIAGFIGADGFSGNFVSNLAAGISGGAQTAAASPFGQYVFFRHPHAEEINMTGLVASTLMFFAGLGAAHLLYFRKGFEADVAAEKAAPFLYRFSFNRWYWDSLYGGIVAAKLKAWEFMWFAVDKFFLDRAIIESITRDGVMGLGHALKFTESGRGQAYALTIVVSVALIGLFVYMVLVPMG